MVNRSTELCHSFVTKFARYLLHMEDNDGAFTEVRIGEQAHLSSGISSEGSNWLPSFPEVNSV